MMLSFFEYNWQVRDEWLHWCEQLSPEALLQKRVGGVGSIQYTLFHIIDVEYSWLRAIQSKDDVIFDFDSYKSLDQLKILSQQTLSENRVFMTAIEPHTYNQKVYIPWEDEFHTVSDILHHLVAHEIHHIGQLTIWARELGLTPISPGYIGRQFSSLSKI
ncbi:DinB family protein [Cytobacillus gottheilii]|uniref:DinB family protein n=1 Tax=Cytobacillus gottheilii TaxID=859144 RepID=UPI003CF76C21